MTRAAPAAPKAPKVQRWVDFIASLLSHRGTLTFDDIAREVPAYQKGNPESVKRTFERDKDELREMGVPIETIGNDGDEDTAYRLRTADFYLPYLTVVTGRGRSTPSRIDKYGYRALAELTFDADELTAVAEAALRARQLGNADLASEVESAMRKLAFDLPVDAAMAAAADVVITKPAAAASAEILRTLSAALVARKRVTIQYRSMSSDRQSPRVVEPYGLFFLDSHWYLAARETESGTLKNFRVSRVDGAKLNKSKAGTADYAIPADFHLRDHARSHQAWELGGGDAIEATVEIRGQSGAALAAAQLGAAVKGKSSARTFRVRRAEVFARWCLSFAGELVPVSPPSIAKEYDRQLAETLALYHPA